MADYYPLLARALDALPDRTPAMRKAVYERARNALIGQLRSLEPPLPEADIELERKALDNAIGRLETDYGAPPAAPVAGALPEPLPTPAATPDPVPPAPPLAPPPGVPNPRVGTAEPPEAVLPPAPPPSFLPPAEPEPAAPPREAAVPIAARRAKAPEPAMAPEPAASADAVPGLAAAPDPAGARRRPRIDVVAPRGGRSRLLRNAFVGVVLAAVIGLIAVAAFLLRDRPAGLQPGASEAADSQPSDAADAKFSDRIGGEAAPKERPPAGSINGMAPTGQRAPTGPTAQPDLAVAQRAVLIEENVAAPNAAPASSLGRVVWRLDSVAGEQGQPLETAIVANVAFPDAGLSLVMTIQRNLDQTLPASHTISLVFAGTGPEGEKRAVQDVGLLQAKDAENARGSPVSGLPVRVRENLFLIGLSSLRGDIDRNTDLLLHRPWFDLAIRYAGGQRAVLTFEVGISGTQALQGAFDQWR
ncbi:histidine kinase [uncultured Methylobacterium sp.]|uniref:histidine kinase n=1 Tax=uncultured Methylobacterium sp. TaxID=157278 RepID=UPI0035CB2B93